MASTGIRIQARREKLGLTRAQLAEELSKLLIPLEKKPVTRLAVWRVETGKVQVPADDLCFWAQALRIKPSHLVS
jgi:transcriptional regulator with XRE-family HTH domain